MHDQVQEKFQKAKEKQCDEEMQEEERECQIFNIAIGDDLEFDGIMRQIKTSAKLTISQSIMRKSVR